MWSSSFRNGAKLEIHLLKLGSKSRSNGGLQLSMWRSKLVSTDVAIKTSKFL